MRKNEKSGIPNIAKIVKRLKASQKLIEKERDKIWDIKEELDYCEQDYEEAVQGLDDVVCSLSHHQ